MVLGVLPFSMPHPCKVSIIPGWESPGPLLHVLLEARSEIGSWCPNCPLLVGAAPPANLRPCRGYSCHVKVSD